MQSHRHLFIVAGAPGSGKSWVCSHVCSAGQAVYVRHDKTPRKKLDETLKQALKDGKPVIYDPTVKVSTTKKAYPDARLVVILDNEENIRRRLENRGGKFTDGVRRRMFRMKTLAKSAEFSGSPEEVKNYLQREILLFYSQK